MEKSSITRDFPVAKSAYAFLNEVSSSFCFPGWNKGRIVCQRSQLKRILTVTEQHSDEYKKDRIITLSNSPFPLPGTNTSMSNVKRDQLSNADAERSIMTRTELMTSTV